MTIYKTITGDLTVAQQIANRIFPATKDSPPSLSAIREIAEDTIEHLTLSDLDAIRSQFP